MSWFNLILLFQWKQVLRLMGLFTKFTKLFSGKPLGKPRIPKVPHSKPSLFFSRVIQGKEVINWTSLTFTCLSVGWGLSEQACPLDIWTFINGFSLGNLSSSRKGLVKAFNWEPAAVLKFTLYVPIGDRNPVFLAQNNFF